MSPAALAALVFGTVSVLLGIYLLTTRVPLGGLDADAELSMYHWLVGVHAGFLVLLLVQLTSRLFERPPSSRRGLAADLFAVLVMALLLIAYQRGAAAVTFLREPAELVFELQYDGVEEVWRVLPPR